jgi:hypothetical protein
VVGDERVHGLALPCGEQFVEPFGDADRCVVVADLPLVVPEHRQSAVAAEAVPPDCDHFPDPAAGEHGGFPHVAQSAVQRVVLGGEAGEVVRVGQRACHLVGERSARDSPGARACRWGGDDELTPQADAIGGAAVERGAQQLAGCVEHDGAGGLADGARGSVRSFQRERGQGVAFTVTLVGDEPVHVRSVQ